MSSSALSLAAAPAARKSALRDRVRLADEALEGPVATLLDARRDPGQRRDRAERAATAGELEGRDVVLRAVVVAGHRRGAQQVDRAVRPDQPTARQRRHGGQPDDEDGAGESCAGSADRTDHRRSPLGGRSVRTGPVGALDSAGVVLGSRHGPVGHSPIAGCRHRAPAADDARMHHRSLRSAIGSAAALAMAVALATGGSLVAAPAAAAADFPSYDSRYHTYAEMVAEIMAAQAAHPDIVRSARSARATRAGPSGSPRYRTTWPTDEPEPEVLFDGAPPRARAPLARADAGDPALADDRLRHRPADHRHSSIRARSGSCSRSTPTAPSTT